MSVARRPWRLDRRDYVVYSADDRVFWVDTTLPQEKFEQALTNALFIIECVNDSGGSRVPARPLPPTNPLDAVGISLGSQQGKSSP